MHDPLPDLRANVANLEALSLFGRADREFKYTRATLHTIPISNKSFALLFSDVNFLMIIKSGAHINDYYS